MSDEQRVPMRRSRAAWLAEGDVGFRIEPPLTGRRFSMDVSEEALAQIGAQALAATVERLGQHVAYEHLPEIRSAVDAYLHDAAWVQPIIEQELRRAVREFVLALWSDDEKKNLRDWFDAR